MPIFIPGMRCTLSGRVINSVDEAVAFPPFVANEADPLYVFSDAVMHAEAFRSHPLAAAAQTRLEECVKRTSPAAITCFVCGRLVTDHEDYLGLGHLVDEDAHPLHRFNYAHFHRSCLAAWPELHSLIESLQEFEDSGRWQGDALAQLIQDLRGVCSD